MQDTLQLALVIAYDPATRKAIIQSLDSDGGALSASVADHIRDEHLQSYCLSVQAPTGDPLVIASIGGSPSQMVIPGNPATTSSLLTTSIPYTTGAPWQDVLSASITTDAPSRLWIALQLEGYTSTQAASALEVRILAGTSQSRVATYGSPMAGLRQAFTHSSVIAAASGTRSVRAQVRNLISGSTVTLTGGAMVILPLHE